MNFRELNACTFRTMKGKYWQICRTLLVYPAAWMVLRLLPCILAWVLISSGTMSPGQLWTDVPVGWAAFSLLWAGLGFCALLPLRCAVCSWILEKYGLSVSQQVFFRTAPAYFSALRYFFCAEVYRMLAYLPFVLGLAGAVSAFQNSPDLPDAGFPLFLTAQFLCLALAGGAYALHAQVRIWMLPLLFLRKPNGSPFQALRRTGQILHGNGIRFWLLALGSVPAMPFALPYVMMNMTLFLEICIREQEQREEMPYARTDFSYAAGGAVHA